MEAYRSRDDFRPVVICNPNSTNSELTDGIIDMISDDERWGKPDIITTESTDPMDNAQDIAARLETCGTSAVWICGGDGLMMSAANAVNLNPRLRTDVRLMPLPVGNACDTSNSLYKGNVLKGAAFLELMSGGEAYAMNCIETTVDGRSRLSVAYAGFQTTAAISGLFADSQWRDSRPDLKLWPPALKRFADHRLADVRDAAAMFKLFHSKPTFTYEEDTIPDHGQPSTKETYEAHDIIYNNVPFYARVGRAAVDVRSGSIMIEFPVGLFRRQLVQAIGQALTTGMLGMPTEERQLTIVSEDVAMHNDGEHLSLEKGNRVTIRDKAAAITVVLPWQS